jgi:hypothetical protein
MCASLASVAVSVQVNSVRFAAPVIPAEDQPPLLVDAYRMEPCQIAAQLLEVIVGRHTKVLVRHSIVDHLELAEQPGPEIGRNVAGTDIFHEEGPQPVIPKADDHSYTLQHGACGPLYNPSYKNNLRPFVAPRRGSIAWPVARPALLPTLEIEIRCAALPSLSG